ncbi:MAG: DinB family protein, partial [Anaerolineales bacterium]
LLAHFVSAEERLLELAQDVVAGGPGIAQDFDFDLFNSEEQQRLQSRSPQELLEALAGDRGATLVWVRTLGDEQLDQIGTHPVLGDVNVEAMILAIYGHQLLHMRELQVLLR